MQGLQLRLNDEHSKPGIHSPTIAARSALNRTHWEPRDQCALPDVTSPGIVRSQSHWPTPQAGIGDSQLRCRLVCDGAFRWGKTPVGVWWETGHLIILHRCRNQATTDCIITVQWIASHLYHWVYYKGIIEIISLVTFIRSNLYVSSNYNNCITEVS